MNPLVLLHETDNVFVCRQTVQPGQPLDIDGVTVVAADVIEVGHKVARRDLEIGDKVLKYGAPIGSMTVAAARGGHVHMHNLKSDYISTHTRAASTGDGQ